MSKKREKPINPLMSDLLGGINKYKETQSPESLERISNAIDQGANCLQSSHFGQTPFTVAIQYGLPKVIDLMLSKNVDPSKANSLGIAQFPDGEEDGYSATPLNVAVTHKQPEIAKCSSHS